MLFVAEIHRKTMMDQDAVVAEEEVPEEAEVAGVVEDEVAVEGEEMNPDRIMEPMDRLRKSEVDGAEAVQEEAVLKIKVPAEMESVCFIMCDDEIPRHIWQLRLECMMMRYYGLFGI